MPSQATLPGSVENAINKPCVGIIRAKPDSSEAPDFDFLQLGYGLFLHASNTKILAFPCEVCVSSRAISSTG